MGVFDPIIELSKGLGESLRSFLFEKTVTYQYPEEKRPVRPRYRGRHVLKRYYEINMLRCIYCGFCEDACPTEAIVLGDNYELSFTDRRQAIYPKEMLLEPVATVEMTTPRKVDAGVFTRSVPEMQNPSD